MTRAFPDYTGERKEIVLRQEIASHLLLASILRNSRLYRLVVKSEDGKELDSFNLKEEDESQEMRAVERRVLLETLAGQLPPDTVQYSSRLARIEASPNGDTLLELVDGSKMLVKIVIGCDGIRSPIAKWMGFPELIYWTLMEHTFPQLVTETVLSTMLENSDTIIAL